MKDEDDFYPKIWGDVAKAAVGLSQVRVARALTRKAEFQTGGNPQGTAAMTGQFAAVFISEEEEEAADGFVTEVVSMNAAGDFLASYGYAASYRIIPGKTYNLTTLFTTVAPGVPTIRVATSSVPHYKRHSFRQNWYGTADRQREDANLSPEPPAVYDYYNQIPSGPDALRRTTNKFGFAMETLRHHQGAVSVVQRSPPEAGSAWGTSGYPQRHVFLGYNTTLKQAVGLCLYTRAFDMPRANDLWGKDCLVQTKFVGAFGQMSLTAATLPEFTESASRHVALALFASACNAPGEAVHFGAVLETLPPPFESGGETYVTYSATTAGTFFLAITYNWGSTVAYLVGDYFLPDDLVGCVQSYTGTFLSDQSGEEYPGVPKSKRNVFINDVLAQAEVFAVRRDRVLLTYTMPVYSIALGSPRADQLDRVRVGWRFVAKLVGIAAGSEFIYEIPMPGITAWEGRARLDFTCCPKEGVFVLRLVKLPPEDNASSIWETITLPGGGKLRCGRQLPTNYVRTTDNGNTWESLPMTGLPEAILTNHEISSKITVLRTLQDAMPEIGMCVLEGTIINLYVSKNLGNTWVKVRKIATADLSFVFGLVPTDASMVSTPVQDWFSSLYLDASTHYVGAAFSSPGLEYPWTKAGP